MFLRKYGLKSYLGVLTFGVWLGRRSPFGVDVFSSSVLNRLFGLRNKCRYPQTLPLGHLRVKDKPLKATDCDKENGIKINIWV